jgi:cell division protein FtsB
MGKELRKMDKPIQDESSKVQGWRRPFIVPAIAVLLCLAAYYVVFSANGLLMYEQKRQESRDLDRQIKALQQQNSSMENEIKALKTDPKIIEKEARERLRYTRPGEVIFTVPVPPPRASASSAKSQK